MTVKINQNLIELGIFDDDYTNIEMVINPVSDKNRYGVYYRHPDTKELHKYAFRPDSIKPFTTMSGIDGRKWDSNKKQYTDGSFKGEWATTMKLFKNAEKPTDDEQRIFDRLREIDQFLLKLLSKILLEDGVDLSQEFGDMVVSHESMIAKNFNGIVKMPDKKKEKESGKKFSPSINLKHPFWYGKGKKEEARALPDPEKNAMKKLMPWKYVNRHNLKYTDDTIKQLYAENLRENKQILTICPVFSPERITNQEGKYFARCQIQTMLCVPQKYQTKEVNVVGKFKNLKIDPEETYEEEPEEAAADEEIRYID